MEQFDLQNKYLEKIVGIDVPILDIGLRNGITGYLDFINPDELGSNNIMKGIDNASRPFIVFKAEFEFSNGLKKKTFTTFFQRYSDDKFLWHCCGHYGKNLMDTSGGTNLEQVKLIYELVVSNKYKINKDLIQMQKLNFRDSIDSISWDNLIDDDFPIVIKLGHSI